MFCQNCGTKIDDGVKSCPKCGTPTTVPKENEVFSDTSNRVENATASKDNQSGTKAKNSMNVISRIIMIAVAVYIIFTVVSFFRSDTSDDSSQSDDDSMSVTADDLDESEKNDKYISAAKQLVSKQLKAPSTAQYSNCVVEEVDEYGRALVTLTVDSQNSFGGMMRSYAVVVIQSFDFENDTFLSYNNYAVQFYNNEQDKNTAIDMTKTLNDWGEQIESEASPQAS